MFDLSNNNCKICFDIDFLSSNLRLEDKNKTYLHIICRYFYRLNKIIMVLAYVVKYSLLLLLFFDKCFGAAHSKRWLKYAFFNICDVKQLKKEEKAWKLRQNLSKKALWMKESFAVVSSLSNQVTFIRWFDCLKPIYRAC